MRQIGNQALPWVPFYMGGFVIWPNSLQFRYPETLREPVRTTTIRRRDPPHHVRAAALLVMPIRDLTLRRINTVIFHHPKLFCDLITVPPPNNAMADKAKKEAPSDPEAIDTKQFVAGKTPEEPRKSIPPPPEKPLPGDCCGSGCVRCVWDVYYEELEEYNKSHKNSPDSSVEPSSSI
ncbi:unnamed protein product [Cuscuta campestris]|uniref:Oxidoreductase-like domain-containing protein n=1 Tax=Cuscuta campestris TaxID=132261 RepID=A0A484LGK4_9ASTE|nr:unnamed protein product [Cuscuta campestris]